MNSERDFYLHIYLRYLAPCSRDVMDRALLCKKSYISTISTERRSISFLAENRGRMAGNFANPTRSRAVDESTPRFYQLSLTTNDIRRTTLWHFVASYRHARIEGNGIRRSGSARDEEDPSVQAWHLRERPYRKDINAWNPGRKLGSAEIAGLFLSPCRFSRLAER